MTAAVKLAEAVGHSRARVAVANAALGFEVIAWRLVGGQKRPAQKGWPHRGTTDPTELDAMFWWEFEDCHPGVVTGPGSNAWVLDLDVRADVDGRATLAALEAEHGPLPKTFTVRTPTGGQHRYFRWPTDAVVATKSWRADPGIDTRGLRGFVGAPGSRNVVGCYEVVADLPIAEAPAWLVARYRRSSGNGSSPIPGRGRAPSAGAWRPTGCSATGASSRAWRPTRAAMTRSTGPRSCSGSTAPTT
jgi:Bifunctional DNA primase/polymerase, N-terminal